MASWNQAVVQLLLKCLMLLWSNGPPNEMKHSPALRTSPGFQVLALGQKKEQTKKPLKIYTFLTHPKCNRTKEFCVFRSTPELQGKRRSQELEITSLNFAWGLQLSHKRFLLKPKLITPKMTDWWNLRQEGHCVHFLFSYIFLPSVWEEFISCLRFTLAKFKQQLNSDQQLNISGLKMSLSFVKN